MTGTSASGLDADLRRDLAAHGVEVADLSDLTQGGGRYSPEVAELLVAWLPRTTDDPSLQEKLVRQLSVPWARTAALGPMLELFRTAPGDTKAGELRRWAVGNALDVLATDAVFDEMAALAADPSYAASRQMVVLWLGKTKQHRDRAVDVLLGLLDQEDVSGHAVKALAKLRDPRSLDALRTMTDDPRAWVRNAAQRTVERLET
ncbi:MAG TPA: HEAT repeat domain-containing protein [Nocardioides sp.]|nr:HEAT repeat domain-containing protein [Nocardioides sp.]